MDSKWWTLDCPICAYEKDGLCWWGVIIKSLSKTFADGSKHKHRHCEYAKKKSLFPPAIDQEREPARIRILNINKSLPPQPNLFGELQAPPKPKRSRIKIPIIDYERPLAPAIDGRMSKLEIAFWKFHENNPEIYKMLIKFACQWRGCRGPKAKLGIKLLVERVRWETSIKTIDNSFPEEFKINNNYTAFYARLIEKYNPRLKGIFRMRQQRIQATIGPDNAGLPSGEHVA